MDLSEGMARNLLQGWGDEGWLAVADPPSKTAVSHPGTSGQNTGKISTRMTSKSAVSGRPTFKKS